MTGLMSFYQRRRIKDYADVSSSSPGGGICGEVYRLRPHLVSDTDGT